jgi:hypothetical protein
MYRVVLLNLSGSSHGPRVLFLYNCFEGDMWEKKIAEIKITMEIPFAYRNNIFVAYNELRIAYGLDGNYGRLCRWGSSTSAREQVGRRLHCTICVIRSKK